jgi:hypothetical protein
MKFTAEELEQIRAVVMAPFQQFQVITLDEKYYCAGAFDAACGRTMASCSFGACLTRSMVLRVSCSSLHQRRVLTW